MQQLPLDLIQPPQPSLENFVVGPNEEAHALLRSLAQADSTVPARIIMLCGPPGCGKSHLLAGLATLPDAMVLPAARPTGAPGNSSELVEIGDQTRVFLADDVADWSAEQHHELFYLINQLRNQSGGRVPAVLVAASRQPPAALKMREDLRTRLASGLTLTLQLLSDEQKATALNRHAQARGLRADQAIINWLLTRQHRDIRHLMAYLDALDRYALQLRRPLTLPLLREFDRKHRPGPPADKLADKL